MQAPIVWLSSEDSDAFNGRRMIAYYWDESLPLEQRLAKATAPLAWPQLGEAGDSLDTGARGQLKLLQGVTDRRPR